MKGAIFDLDGTLADSMQVWVRVDEVWFAQNGLAYSREIGQIFKTMYFHEAALYVIERYGLAKTPQQILAEWKALAQEEYALRVQLKDGAAAYLETLRQQGVKMAVATACFPEGAEAVLQGRGVRSYFDAVVYSEEVGAGKSRPDIFFEAARRLGVSPADCVVFEDSLHAVDGALAAGMGAVGVYDEFSKADFAALQKKCGKAIRSFRELL